VLPGIKLAEMAGSSSSKASLKSRLPNILASPSKILQLDEDAFE
jgi:hypothetical protein